MASEDEGEPEVYCICRSGDANRFMIACDHCEEWYHGDCVNVKERDAKYIKKYFCKVCIEKNPKLQIIYKSKYKDKEGLTMGTEHSKQREKESKSINEKYREKYNNSISHSKSKSIEKEKSRDKERERSKSSFDKHRDENRDKDHKRKHRDHSHKKYHHRDKDRKDHDKSMRDKEKHREDKYDMSLDRDKRKDKTHSNLLEANKSSHQPNNENRSGKIETETFSHDVNASPNENKFNFKQEKSESLPKDLESSKKDIDSKKDNHLKNAMPKSISNEHVPSQKSEPKLEKLGIKQNTILTSTPSRKDSFDREVSNKSLNVHNSSSRKSVLKELKNIPETDESAALDIAIKSDEEFEIDSDEQWTEHTTKSSSKSAFAKVAKKRAKSPISKKLISSSKKRRHLDSANNRRVKRGSTYYKGDSSDEGDTPLYGNVPDVSELRQCYGHKCVKPARTNSNYCSDECGINLASHRIVQTLPDRLREWNLTPCVADERNQKELQKIRSEQDAVKSRLEQLNVDFRSLEELIARSKLQPIEKEKEDEEDGGDNEKPSETEMTVYCVTCGQDLHTRTAIRHMERCYNKFESQTSFASKFKTQIENHRLFCDHYDPKEQTYCKRLNVLCPEHKPDPKFLDEDVCGYPIQNEIFGAISEFCRLPKKHCKTHAYWEKLRRAEIDMQRVQQWVKMDELIEQEKAVKKSMLNRKGVLGLLLHSTFNHELDNRFKAAKAAQLLEAEKAQAKAKEAAYYKMTENQALTTQQSSASEAPGISVTPNRNTNTLPPPQRT